MSARESIIAVPEVQSSSDKCRSKQCRPCSPLFEHEAKITVGNAFPSGPVAQFPTPPKCLNVDLMGDTYTQPTPDFIAERAIEGGALEQHGLEKFERHSIEAPRELLLLWDKHAFDKLILLFLKGALYLIGAKPLCPGGTGLQSGCDMASHVERAPAAGTHITYGAYACELSTTHFTCDENNLVLSQQVVSGVGGVEWIRLASDDNGTAPHATMPHPGREARMERME
ncbi:hypothetical protein BKA70DRAFT_1514872 [Coprinopsis sp. MPI-PUGE-AT-0042]|nr:hypothetical protein BKA70DRAFT_1514872 [Coprinopsis sp. MPI-PUGE-AT-0042]